MYQRPFEAMWVIQDLPAQLQNPHCINMAKFYFLPNGIPDHRIRRLASPYQQVNWRQKFVGIKWPLTPNITMTHKLDLHLSLFLIALIPTSDTRHPKYLIHSKHLDTKHKLACIPQDISYQSKFYS